MATIAHPTAEFAQRQPAGSARAVLERAVDAAATRIPPPRGWLRRLFARDCSARALIERYRLWPEIEYVYQRITGELGAARIAMSAEDDCGDWAVVMDCHVAWRDDEAHLDLEEELRRELIHRLGSKRYFRLSVLVHRGAPPGGCP